MPTIWCVGSVPERMPRSWPPPCICASMRTRGLRRTYSAPMPFGPYVLCAENDIRSTFSFARSISTLPVACAASTWNTMPFSRQSSPIVSMSWITPISLFTCITDTRIVSGRSAALSTSRSRRPLSFTSR